MFSKTQLEVPVHSYYRWSKDFLEAGKKQLAGDTKREATSDEIKELRSENRELKKVVEEITLKNRVLKKEHIMRADEVFTKAGPVHRYQSLC